MKKYCTEIILAIILLALSLISIFVGVIDIDIKDLLTNDNNALMIFVVSRLPSSTSPAPKQALHKPTFNASESHCWFSPIIYYMFLRSKYYSYSQYLHISKSLSMHIMHFCHSLSLISFVFKFQSICIILYMT